MFGKIDDIFDKEGLLLLLLLLTMVIMMMMLVDCLM